MIFKRFSFILCVAMLYTVPLKAQQLLSGDLDLYSEQTVYFSSFYGINMNVIDSATTDKKGSFKIPLRKEYLTGYYRLSTSPNNYIDLIVNGKERILINCKDSLLQKTTIQASEENLMLEKLKRKKRQIKETVGQLSVQQSYLEKGSDEYQNLQAIKDTLNNNFNRFANQLIAEKPESFFAQTTKAYLQPNNQSTDQDEVKKHFFDHLDFSNPALIRTTLLPNIYMKYLQQHTQYNEEGFKSSIDVILSKAKANSEVFQLSLEFLMDLFGRVGPELIFEYLVENYYLTESCGNELLTDSIALKAKKYTILQAGATAPSPILADLKGNDIDLKSVWEKQEITLIYFWASFCHFCEEEHPNMKKLYDTYNEKGLEICAISLDTDAKEWKSAVKKHQMDWINLSELKGWKSNAVDTYRVNKTPTIYLIGKNGTILAKGLKGKSLEKFVKNYLE